MSDKLICTNCDEVVCLEVGYDGYCGKCSCDTFYMAPGSDRPYCWKELGDVQSPANFKVTTGEWDDDAEGFAGQEAICLSCGAGENVTVGFEQVAGPEGYTVKATFECSSGHGVGGRKRTSVAYYHPKQQSGDFIPSRYQHTETEQEDQ